MAEQLTVEVDVKNVTQWGTAAAAQNTQDKLIICFRINRFQ